MRLFFTYVRERRHFIFALLVFFGIFTAIFSLYHLETEAVLYAGLLCVLCGALFCGFGFSRAMKRHKRLRALLYDLEQTAALGLEKLPEPQGMTETDYDALLRAEESGRRAAMLEAVQKEAEQVEYYTLWCHQIKTPIAAMRLLLQNATQAETEHPERSSGALQTELHAALQAELFKTECYVEMVLAYLRMGSESTDYVIQAYALDEIVKQAVRKYAPLFINSKIGLDLQPISYTVLTDEKWLCFVLEQLLSNALKYTKKGKVSIYLDEEERLVIVDTGIGIRQEDIPRLCEKGYTGHNGRMDKRASGVGLYLSKRILERLGHSIEITSTVGVGTCLRLTLRRETSPDLTR